MSLRVPPDMSGLELTQAEQLRQNCSSQLLLTGRGLFNRFTFINLWRECAHMCVFPRGTCADKVCIFNLRACLSVCAPRHSGLATGWLRCLQLLFHKREWKTQSQHAGMSRVSAGSRSGHTSANPTLCMEEARERERLCVLDARASACIHIKCLVA